MLVNGHYLVSLIEIYSLLIFIHKAIKINQNERKISSHMKNKRNILYIFYIFTLIFYIFEIN